MKKTIKSIILLFTMIILSCETDYENHMSGDAVEGGATVKVLPSSLGKALGVPQASDLETTDVAFTDVTLDLNVALQYGGADIEKYEIVKTLIMNDGTSTDEVVVATGANLTLSVNYSTIAEYLDGTGVSNSSDLRIGNVFLFRTKMYKTSGEIAYPANGTYSVKVGCSSDLAYSYEVTTTRSDGAQWNQGIELLVEKSPGLYKTVTTGGWGAGTIAPDQGYDFEDLCNNLSVPNQDLAQGYYSNDVYQTDAQKDASVVDPITGNLHIEYTISFSSGDSEYSADYIKQ